MDIPTLLSVAVLGSIIANLINWRRRDGELFGYQPRPGFPRILFLSWTVAVGIASGLLLLRVIPASVFLGITLGFTIAHEWYSIIRRQAQRARP